MRILKTLLIYTPTMAQATTRLASDDGYLSSVDDLAKAYPTRSAFKNSDDLSRQR